MLGRKRAPTGAVQPDTTQADDEVRSLQAARDDPAQFAPVYERYFDRIFAYCRYRVGPQEAEDVTSQVFIRALDGLDGYRGGSVAAWLFRIAHNCVVDHLRYRRPQVSLDETELQIAAPGLDLIEQLVEAEEWQTVRQLVAALPDEQINLLTLKMVSGLNATEIAGVVGKSAVAVRVELHRIFKQLRARYHALEREGNS
jgi:RNA polymerase sigma-70 factor (ECF subfamily)